MRHPGFCDESVIVKLCLENNKVQLKVPTIPISRFLYTPRKEEGSNTERSEGTTDPELGYNIPLTEPLHVEHVTSNIHEKGQEGGQLDQHGDAHEY